jgi:hypothetical protein
MNTTAIIIGLGFLAMFIIPLIYISNAGNNKKKKYHKLLSEFAAEHSCKIEEYDQWKNSCIGLDLFKKKIFYISKQDKELKKTQINLNDISKCKLSGINYANINQANTIIELNFAFLDANANSVKLEFFNTAVDTFIVEDDLKLPEKWLSIVNLQLESKVKQ